jgi:hypothetical protein
VLVGDQNVETFQDNNAAGIAEAFQYAAGASGVADTIAIYVDTGNAAAQVVVGLYTNSAGNAPGSLLTQATLANPAAGAWNSVAVPSASISAGTQYWIAVLGPSGSGTVRFRDVASGGRAQTSLQANLATLPATWSPGTTYANSPMSAYVAQVGVDMTPPTISNVAAGNIQANSATISWTTDEGATSQVKYGTTSALGSTTPLDASLVTSHSQSLSGLTSNTQYSYQVVSKDAAGNQTASPILTFTTADPNILRATVGEWSPVMSWPLVAVHATLLNTGQVLMWDAWETGGTASARLWNPTTQAFTGVPNSFSQLFCSGHATLADGRAIVIGGHNGGDTGIVDTDIFNQSTSAWSRVANMNQARWYPSATTLADGRVLALSGQITPGVFADIPEVYNPATNAWTQLGSIRTTSVHEEEYPLAWLAPNGQTFVIAPSSGATGLLDAAAPSWTSTAANPLRNESGAMYQPGKILTTGGGALRGNSQTAAAVIDLNAATPAWRQVAPMAYPRYMHNLTVLPDGNVLAVGGSSTVNIDGSAIGVLPAEQWNPRTETWTTMAAMHDARMYHSIALLLPDGRVLSAGGGRFSTGIDYLTAEIYSPPYLFKGTRPTITGAPVSAGYGTTITIQSPDAAGIAKVALIRLASVTHTIDMNQRYLELGFTAGAGSLSVQTPASANLAPPGDYMLFLVDSNGVPSVAQMVRVGGAAPADTTPPSVSLTTPSNGATVSGSTSVAASASDNVGVASVQFLLDGAALGAPDTTAPYGITWDTTAVANGSHILSARASDAAGNSSTAANVTVSVANVDTTPPAIANLAAGNIQATAATITWSTNEPATSQVDYGLTIAYGSQTAPDSTLTTSHSQGIAGLAAATTYHYRVRSADAAGNTAVSGDATFTTAAAGSPTTLLGDQNIEATQDNNPAGKAEAFQYTATTSGTANKLSIYLDSASSATKVIVGVYTNTSGNNPGTLLAQATIASPVKGAWNTVTLPSISIAAGTPYWIAVLGPSGSGVVRFRDVATGGKAQTSSQGNLSALPATWTPGTTYANSPMSAYVQQAP